MDYLNEFIMKLKKLNYSSRSYEVFRDFLILSSCSLAQPFYKSDELEQYYLDTVSRYTKEQAEKFSELLALLISALCEKHQDFLGTVYMQLNMGNVANGQYFTPYHLSKFMSEITYTDIQDKEIITLSEPCCGSGCMVIAYAETLLDKGINYQNRLFVEANDIDEICFMMTYIQFALYGIPARVMLGDTIAWKFKKILYTPMYFINGFEWKLKRLEENIDDKREQNISLNLCTETKQLHLFSLES